jgi:DnaJ-domain-containing protein 1
MPNQSTAYLIYCIIENKRVDYSNLSLINDLDEITYKDIAAVVKQIDTKSIEELRLNNDLLRNWLASYQQINIDIFNNHTILPLRFGTIVDQKEEIEDFLASNYIHIKWALDRLKEKAEITVQLSWDLNSVLQEISQDKQWHDNANQPINLADKVEIGKRLFVIANTKKREILESVHQKLLIVSLEFSDGRAIDEQIIMNRSYLIEKSSEGLFDESMVELAKENKSYFSFKYIGPLPPYSFAPVEFERGNFELIDNARKTLLLPEQANYKEIKTSYRSLSMKYHPDKNSVTQQSSEHFREINNAYKILDTYCHNYDEVLASRKNSKYSFTQDDVEGIFIANRRRVNV